MATFELCLDAIDSDSSCSGCVGGAAISTAANGENRVTALLARFVTGLVRMPDALQMEIADDDEKKVPTLQW